MLTSQVTVRIGESRHIRRHRARHRKAALLALNNNRAFYVAFCASVSQPPMVVLVTHLTGRCVQAHTHRLLQAVSG